MILEAATLYIKPGAINDFESVFRSAYGIISKMQGYLGHELYKCIENKDEYILLIRWNAIHDRSIGLRHSPDYKEWNALLQPFYDPQPEVKHYIDIPVEGREYEREKRMNKDE
ncbi:MAG: antibiotic biosynthesis monooxygenase family protein [Bacillota bacterium]